MPGFTTAPRAEKPTLDRKSTRRDLWSDVEEHADLHVEQGGSGSSLPFDSETVPVEQEVRHTNSEIYAPSTAAENTQVELDKEDLDLAHQRLKEEQDEADHVR